MKNKEKYAKEIVEIVCEGCALAVSKETGKPVKCVNIKCSECTLGGSSMCSTMIKEWAESERTLCRDGRASTGSESQCGLPPSGIPELYSGGCTEKVESRYEEGSGCRW